MAIECANETTVHGTRAKTSVWNQSVWFLATGAQPEMKEQCNHWVAGRLLIGRQHRSGILLVRSLRGEHSFQSFTG